MLCAFVYAVRRYLSKSKRFSGGFAVELRHNVALFIWGLSGLLAVSISATAWYGISLYYQRKKWGWYSPVTLRRHKQLVKLSFLLMLAAVLAIEVSVWSFSLPLTLYYFQVHRPILIAFGAFFCLACIFNGERSKGHMIFAPPVWLFYIATAITGDILVYRLLWL
jgi:hypothetical protein